MNTKIRVNDIQIELYDQSKEVDDYRIIKYNEEVPVIVTHVDGNKLRDKLLTLMQEVIHEIIAETHEDEMTYKEYLMKNGLDKFN